jgi:hypothetical protein
MLVCLVLVGSKLCCFGLGLLLLYIYVVLGALFSIKNTALNWHQHRGNDALETLQCQK